MQKPVIVCLDLEGVLVPEIWINVALKTGIDELKITTREMPDYDALMKRRLAILDQHKLTIHDIQSVIAKMGPLEGANDFVAWLRSIKPAASSITTCGCRIRRNTRWPRSNRSTFVSWLPAMPTTTPPCWEKPMRGSFSVLRITFPRSSHSFQ